VNELNNQGQKVALAHFNYISPLPANTAEVLRRYKTITVCELNNGQFAGYLRSKVEGITLQQYNKIEGQPFTVNELTTYLKTLLEK
jgi:2-oxoglutarate/2-oxoacid ferredoxin oxidoreductase subunit alpha